METAPHRSSLSRPLDRIERPLVFFTDGLGDLLMFVPTVRALAEIFPGRLEIMCRSAAAPMIYAGIDLARMHADILQGRDGDDPFPAEEIPPEVAATDCLICLNDWDSPAVDSFVSAVAPRDSIGFDPVFDLVLERRFDVHNSEFAFEVPRSLDPRRRIEDHWGPIEYSERALRATAEMGATLPHGALLVAVHPETAPVKNLEREGWGRVLQGLLERYPSAYFLVLGLRDAGLDQLVSEPDRVISCHGAPLDVSIGLVGRADFFIGADSSMLHAADLNGTPGVGVFTATDPVRWGFGRTAHRHVRCPQRGPGAGEVERVLKAFEHLVAEQGGPPAAIEVRSAASARPPSSATTAELLTAQRPVALFGYGIGDHLIHLPTLRALTEIYPGRLAIKCHPGLDGILYSDLDLRAVFADEFSTDSMGEAIDPTAIPRALREADLLLSLNNWDSPAFGQLLSQLEPIPSIGFDPECSHPLPYDFDKHTSELSFDVARRLEPSRRLGDHAGPPRLPAAAEDFARALRSDLGADRSLLAVQPRCASSVRSVADHVWSLALAQFLERRPDYEVVLLGSEPTAIEVPGRGDRIHACGGLPLADSLALVAVADLFAGIDSSLLHAADLFRVPTVAVFGRSRSIQWGTAFTPTSVYEVGPDLGATDPQELAALLLRGAGPAAQSKQLSRSTSTTMRRPSCT